MKIDSGKWWIVACLGLGISASALAQETAPAPAAPAAPVVTVPTTAAPPAAPAAEATPAPTLAIAPSPLSQVQTPDAANAAAAGAAPVAPAASTASVGYFPALPPSRPCVADDLRGMWKLTQVYENPLGNDYRDFSASPVQYMYFKNDGTYGMYKSTQMVETEMVIRERLEAPATTLLQFVFREGGTVYFYQDGVATKTLACFVVANVQEPFAVGQMLLMPPESEAAGRRLLYSYQLVRRAQQDSGWTQPPSSVEKPVRKPKAASNATDEPKGKKARQAARREKAVEAQAEERKRRKQQNEQAAKKRGKSEPEPKKKKREPK